MNWVTTNIRLSEDRYMELKIMAAQNRKSIAELVRNGVDIILNKKKKNTSKNAKKLLRELDELAKENDRQNPGISFSEKLIEMRYEQ